MVGRHSASQRQRQAGTPLGGTRLPRLAWVSVKVCLCGVVVGMGLETLRGLHWLDAPLERVTGWWLVDGWLCVGVGGLGIVLGLWRGWSFWTQEEAG